MVRAWYRMRCAKWVRGSGCSVSHRFGWPEGSASRRSLRRSADRRLRCGRRSL